MATGPYGNDHVGATFSPAEIKGETNLDKETTRELEEKRRTTGGVKKDNGVSGSGFFVRFAG